MCSMYQSTRNANELLLGGVQPALFKFDLGTQAITRRVRTPDTDCTLIRSNEHNMLCASSSGSVSDRGARECTHST
jgi:hypothetical protein